MTAGYEFLQVERQGPVLGVALNRPDVHNALNASLIAELTSLFSSLADSGDGPVGDGDDAGGDDARVVVLSGAGPSFSAGADLNVMRAAAAATRAENEEDARALPLLLDAIDSCPLPVVARVHGAALGGAMGLLSVCDVVVAAESALFGFTEARLGIAPSLISPYVFRAIGVRQARALFVTGERFDAARALHIGLVHRVATAEGLDDAVAATVKGVLQCGPFALAACKRLTRVVPTLDEENARAFTIETLATLREGDEGREGLRAFLEKREPSFATTPPAPSA